MNSMKCPQCGLVNFATASECKRCHLEFSKPESAAGETIEPDQSPLASTATEAPNESAPVADNDKKPLAPLPEYFEAEPAPFTLGMILFAVYLILSTMILGRQVQLDLQLIGSHQWAYLIDPRNKYYVSTLEPLVYFELIFKGLAMLASIFLLVPFLRKSYAFLKWVRVYLLATFLYVVIDGAASLSLRTSLTEKKLGADFEPMLDELYWASILCVASFLITFLWFRYLTTSDRVKQTFIN